MKNLENLGLIELTLTEKRNTEGGFRFNLSIFGYSIVSYDSHRPDDSNWRTDLW